MQDLGCRTFLAVHCPAVKSRKVFDVSSACPYAKKPLLSCDREHVSEPGPGFGHGLKARSAAACARGFGVQGLGFGVQGLGFGVQGSGFRVKG